MVKELYGKQPEGMNDMDWKDLEAKVATTIRLCLVDDMMYHVMDEESPTVIKNIGETSSTLVNCGYVMMGNDASCKVLGIRNIIIKIFDGVVKTLCDVRHLQVYKWSNEGEQNLMTMMKWQKLAGNIYKLLDTTIVGGFATVESESNSTALWHMQLGHMGERGMLELYKRNLLKGIKTCKLDLCKYCVFGKQNKQFKTTTHKTKGVLDYVHTYVWGLVRVASLGGNNGTKYTDSKFTELCEQHGTKRHFIVHKTPKRNTRCLKLNAGLEKKFWAEAVNMACYLINRSPRATLDGKVEEDVWTGSLVDYSGLRVFGCLAYVHILNEERSKLDAKSRQCIFLGYQKGVKGFKLWDPKAN
ncbi:hypothetical protein AAG906_029041 [Vitis piasezkii]